MEELPGSPETRLSNYSLGGVIGASASVQTSYFQSTADSIYDLEGTSCDVGVSAGPWIVGGGGDVDTGIGTHGQIVQTYNWYVDVGPSALPVTGTGMLQTTKVLDTWR
jgi:hypothetical protein